MLDYDDVQASMKASQEKNWLQQHIQISPHPSVTFVLNIFQKILQENNFQSLEKKGLLPHIKIFAPQLQIFHNLEREGDQIDWMTGIRDIAGKRSKLS